MATYTQRVTLDVAGNYLPFYKYMTQGDGDSTYLVITLTANGTKLVPGSGDTAYIRVTKPDKKIVNNPATVNSDGTVTARITKAMTAVAGVARADIAIVGQAGDTLSTAVFFLDIDAGPGTEGITSTNEFLELVAMVKEGKELIGGYATALDQLEAIKSETKDAAEAASDAASGAADAKSGAEDAAKLAESYAKGGTSTRDGEEIDNAKYYKEQASEAASSASGSASNAAAAEGRINDAVNAGVKTINDAAEAASKDLAEDARVVLDRAEELAEAFDADAIIERLDNLEPGMLFNSGYQDEEGYLHLTMDDVDLDETQFTPFLIRGGSGSGGGSGATIKITNLMSSRALTVLKEVTAFPMRVSWSSIDVETEEETGSGSASWRVNGTRVAVQTVPQGEYSFDIRKYLTDGTTNTVQLTIEDSYGTSRSFSWTVTVATFTLSWNLPEVGYNGSGALTVRLEPNGVGTKTVNVTVDGTSVYSQEITTSGRTVLVTVPAQSHGSHVVKAWMTGTADGVDLSTDVLMHTGIWSEDGYTAPVIAVGATEITAQQYATVNIKYMVYDPQSETAQIVRAVDGVNDAIITADRTVQNWAYRPTASGEHTLTLTCGSTSATISVTVEAIGHDVQAVEGAVVDIDPTGHTNNETGVTNFGYKDADGVMHPFNYSANFDWTSGGFQQDDQGITAFVIKRGTYVLLDRSLFNDNAKENGKEIKIVFKAANARNYDAEILTNVANGVGLTLGAQSALLTSTLENYDVPYCENRKIELDINIESTSETDNRFVMLWLEGVPSRAKVYSPDDIWRQTSPTTLKIGSDDCDVWLYRLKMYPNSLTKYEILDNFIADCSDPVEMMARYERNNIFSADGSVDINALANNNPDLRIIRISAQRITTGKKDDVVSTIQHILQNGGANDNWTAVNAVHKAQGTSSLDYALAALNLDIDLSKGTWTNADGDTMTAYAMTSNSIPVSYFNIKLNVASSENANNVLLADEYNLFQPWKSAARREDSRVRDTVEGHPCCVFFTNTSDETITVGSHVVAPGETIFYGCGDMNNSKKNNAVFGQDTSKWPDQCCIEISNNNNDQCKFKSDDLSNETWGDKKDDNFEFRYGESDEAKARLQNLLTWMKSVDASAATNLPLGTPVTIGGVGFANDTAEYRGAKFKAEVGNYFVVDSLLYHYLFTERHLMVDNRAKNCFISYEYDPDSDKYLWNFCKDYDNDTADGNDNSGGLTFTYGLEDTDTIGAAKVFNASDSALWCNIRDYMFSELQAMFQRCESAGAWSASRILAKFETYQAARPEALVAEDMWAKYITPYLHSGETRYFAMLYGNKTDQRRQFEVYQEPYMASKYMSALATSDSIEFRANTPTDYVGVAPSGDMTVTPYSDIYVVVRYGNAGIVRVRAKRGVETEIVCPTKDLVDTETYVYSASHISGLSGLASLYTKLATLANATHLTRLELGSGEPGYANTSLGTGDGRLSFGNNPMLEYVDLRGTPNLVQALDLSGLSGLRELYLTNSGVTGVSFAVGAILETAYLPAILSLTARKLIYLTTLSCSATRITRLWVEESPGVDSYTICASAPNLAAIRLLDVNWTDADPDVVLGLINLAGIDANGNDTENAVLTGYCHISALTEAELNSIRAAFPSLVVSYDEIVPAYTVTFKNYDGTTVYTGTVRKGGTAVDPVSAGLIAAPTRESTVDTVYTYRGWDKALTNITVNTTFTANFVESVRRYTVQFMYDAATPLYTRVVEAHTTLDYEGSKYNCPDVLTPPEEDQIWAGWDTLTADVTADLVVTALFISPEIPSVIPSTYDYLYSDDASDNSAYTLAEFYGVVKNGLTSDYFKVGDKIKIVPLTSVFADSSIILEVMGFNHFKKPDGTFAGVVFQMIGLMNANRQMYGTGSNAGGWPGTSMRTWLNETVLPALPRQWQSMITTVVVRSSAGQTKADIVTSNDKLFLLSQAEVGFDAANVPYVNEVDPEAEQVTFAKFINAGSRIKKTYNGTGTAGIWWLRSPDPGSYSNYRYVYNNGGANSNSATASHGVAFSFCM